MGKTCRTSVRGCCGAVSPVVFSPVALGGVADGLGSGAAVGRGFPAEAILVVPRSGPLPAQAPTATVIARTANPGTSRHRT
jgi:hypothetical protein